MASAAPSSPPPASTTPLLSPCLPCCPPRPPARGPPPLHRWGSATPSGGPLLPAEVTVPSAHAYRLVVCTCGSLQQTGWVDLQYTSQRARPKILRERAPQVGGVLPAVSPGGRGVGCNGWWGGHAQYLGCHGRSLIGWLPVYAEHQRFPAPHCPLPPTRRSSPR